jgi:hypothetical protein
MLGRKVLYGLMVVVVVAALALSGYAVARAGGATQAVAGEDTAARGITVVGIGKVTGKPDIARVTVGVETQGPSLQTAVDENKAKMNVLLDTLKQQGVAEKDMRTSNYSVYTERLAASDGAGTNQLIYHVANQVEVTVRDVNQLGDVLDKAVAAGANNIYGVYFNVEDTAKLETDARAKAVADAQERAADLARLNGVELGEVLSVSEVIGGATPVYRVAEGMGGGGTPVQPGELEVSVSLQITYAIQ